MFSQWRTWSESRSGGEYHAGARAAKEFGNSSADTACRRWSQVPSRLQSTGARYLHNAQLICTAVLCCTVRVRYLLMFSVLHLNLTPNSADFVLSCLIKETTRHMCAGERTRWEARRSTCRRSQLAIRTKSSWWTPKCFSNALSATSFASSSIRSAPAPV